MRRLQLITSVVSAAAVAAGCAHDSETTAGYRIQTGEARFDAQTVTTTSKASVLTLESDGSWASLEGERYERVGDELRNVGGGGPSADHTRRAVPLIQPFSSVRIERLPDGLRYTPSYPGSPIWTFVTADGQPLPADIEVPLYLAARIGLGGQYVAPEGKPGAVPVSGCNVWLFELQNRRQVAAWEHYRDVPCPAPFHPGADLLARLSWERGVVWLSPELPPR